MNPKHGSLRAGPVESSLNEKLDVIQGLDKEILDLSTVKEIVSEIEERYR